MGSASGGRPSPSRVVMLPTRVDMENVGEVETLLRHAVAGGGEVEFDCAELRFVDSAGAKMLFQLADYAYAHSCAIHITNLHDGPLRVLTLLGIFELYQRRGE